MTFLFATMQMSIVFVYHASGSTFTNDRIYLPLLWLTDVLLQLPVDKRHTQLKEHHMSLITSEQHQLIPKKN